MSLLQSADDWFTASSTERNEVAESIARKLGAAWNLASTRAPNVHFTHVASGLTFVLVPGGTLSMGLETAELRLIETYLGSRKHITEQLDQVRRYALPVSTVRVEPFLCGTELLSQKQIELLSPGTEVDPLGAVNRKHALQVSAALGYRLPSDAELEWLARQGAGAPFVLDCAFEAPSEDDSHVLITDQPIRARFGVCDLFETQWAADDWFESHQQRPGDAAVRWGGDAQGVRRFEEFYFEAVGREAVISQLSARRDPGRGWRARVRLALDLPEQP